MKKTIISLLLITLFFGKISSQTSSWMWAKTAIGNNDEAGTCITTDAQGNSYVGGEYTAQHITFGSFTLNNTQISGAQDVFVVKYDNVGNVLWARGAGGQFLDFLNSVAIDNQGNCFVTGSFSGYSFDFGTMVLLNPHYTSSSSDEEAYIAKYSPAGVLLWAKTIGGPNSDEGTGIKADRQGNIFVTGDFYSSAFTIDSTTVFNTQSNQNTADFFTAKLNSNGDLIWLKSDGGSLDELSRAITVDSSGCAIVGGEFTSTSFSIGTIPLHNSNYAVNKDLFLTKYDTAGNIVWARSIGDTLSNDEFLNDIDADRWGNIYIGGTIYSYTITFGTDTVINSSGNLEGFFAKFNSNGQPLWGRGIGGVDNDWLNGVKADRNGNVFVSGNFESNQLLFDTTTITNSNYLSGYTDIYVASFDSSGAFRWCNGAGGYWYENTRGIGIDTSYNCYITGESSSYLMNFGSIPLNLNNPNATTHVCDFYIAKVGFPNFTNVPEHKTDHNISVYPNPSNGQFRIFCDEIPQSVIVTDILGEFITSVKPAVMTFEMQLNSGVYFITFNYKNERVVKRIIVN